MRNQLLTSIIAIVGIVIGGAAPTTGKAANIAVEYSGDDAVGREIAYEMREKVAASSQHRLVHRREDAAYRLILVTVGSDGGNSAYSAVLVLKNFVDGDALDYFVTTFAGMCGRNVAKRCAANVMAGVDEEISGITSAVLGILEKK